jgi:hypothetical protein
MYHTFEFTTPSDLKAKGLRQDPDDPRRNYVTPLDTNQPAQYSTPPGPRGYEGEYTHVISFTFLVDDKGMVHVRPFGVDTGFTTLELSTITGTSFPEPLEREEFPELGDHPQPGNPLDLPDAPRSTPSSTG